MNEHHRAAPDVPGAYSSHLQAAMAARTEPIQPDWRQPEPKSAPIPTPSEGFVCDACQTPAAWEDGWEVTTAMSQGGHSLIAYRLVCTACMQQHAPMLVIVLTRDQR